jgi:hypothetical protein
MRKAYLLLKFLRGFQIRIGLPFPIAAWIPKKIFPPMKCQTEIRVETGWVNATSAKETP